MSSIDTNQLFRQYNKLNNQSGGGSVDTNQLFNNFLNETSSVQSGGMTVEQVDQGFADDAAATNPDDHQTNTLETMNTFRDSETTDEDAGETIYTQDDDDDVQSGGGSVDTHQLFNRFLNETSSQSGGNNGEVIDNGIIEEDNGIIDEEDNGNVSVQSGGGSVDTNQLFNKFLNETASVQSGGNIACDDWEAQGYDNRGECVRDQKGGGSVDTNQLFNKFLNETASVQSGGAESVDVEPVDFSAIEQASIESEEEIPQEQYGGNRKPISLKKAVSLLKQYYKNKYNN